MKLRLFIRLCLLGALIAGCGPSVGNPAGGPESSTRAWFDAPLPGTVMRPPNPCQIVAHGGSPSGIALFELSINGAVQPNIPSPDTKSSLATLTRDCGLTDPGEYLLRIRAQDNSGNWSNYAETSLIIPGEGTATATAPTGAAPAAPIDTVAPTATPTPVAAAAAPAVPGSVSIESISSDLIYAGARTCGPLQVTITAHATAPKAIQVVVLFYRFQPGTSSGFADVAMNPIGGDLYQVSLNPTSLVGGPLEAEQVTLQYQVVVQQVGGDTSIRTPVLADISVQACGGPAAPPEAACSSYSDKRSCQAHGCKWAAGAGVVPVYSCQKP